MIQVSYILSADAAEDSRILADILRAVPIISQDKETTVMSLIAVISMVVTLWGQYGGDVLIALSLIADLEKLAQSSAGKAMLSDVEAIFAAHGVSLDDVATSISSATSGSVSTIHIGR